MCKYSIPQCPEKNKPQMRWQSLPRPSDVLISRDNAIATRPAPSPSRSTGHINQCHIRRASGVRRCLDGICKRFGISKDLALNPEFLLTFLPFQTQSNWVQVRIVPTDLLLCLKIEFKHWVTYLLAKRTEGKKSSDSNSLETNIFVSAWAKQMKQNMINRFPSMRIPAFPEAGVKSGPSSARKSRSNTALPRHLAGEKRTLFLPSQSCISSSISKDCWKALMSHCLAEPVCHSLFKHQTAFPSSGPSNS